MPRSIGDLKHTPIGNFGRLSEPELLAIVGLGRVSEQNEDKQRAQGAWQELVLREFDRVRQITKTFCFPGHPTVRIPRDAVDDVAQIAFIRLFDMLPNFRGTSEGEFRAALKRCVEYACMDYCRKDMRIDKKLEGSLDEQLPSADGTGTTGRFDGALGQQAREMDAARERARDRLAEIGQALDELPNEQMKSVVRLSWEGHDTEQIAAKLGLSVDNVYQLRSRGHRKIEQSLGRMGSHDGIG